MSPGRAGQSGDAISLVCNNERAFLKQIEKLISQKIPMQTEDGFEPDVWPDRMPSAAEVTKADAERKKQARQQRGPRRPRNGGSGGKQKSNKGGDNRSSGSNKKSSESPAPSSRRRSNTRRRRR